MNTLLETPLDKTTTADTFHVQQPNALGRIMVVDDDEIVRHLVMHVLMRLGFEVTESENGIRAWKALHLKNYDLLITDHNMPKMTGLQLVRKLHAAGFNLPIIFASGNTPPELMDNYESPEVAAILPKPFALHELIQTVKRLLPGSMSELIPSMQAQ